MQKPSTIIHRLRLTLSLPHGEIRRECGVGYLFCSNLLVDLVWSCFTLCHKNISHLAKVQKDESELTIPSEHFLQRALLRC